VSHRPQPLPDYRLAFEQIDKILGETWSKFQRLILDPNHPSGYREPTREEWRAGKRLELENAKAAARDGAWWPLVKILLDHYPPLDKDAERMLALRALYNIGREELTEEALEWIGYRYCASETPGLRYYFSMVKFLSERPKSGVARRNAEKKSALQPIEEPFRHFLFKRSRRPKSGARPKFRNPEKNLC
jgi:hypothetical protein